MSTQTQTLWGGKVTQMLQIILLTVMVWTCLPVLSMSPEEKHTHKEKAREMFLHGYNSYMKYAYPADELMPLSCKGRYRGSEPSRGDVDDALGNFSLTLVDSLDTLFIMNETVRFEQAVRLVVDNVQFDSDIDVSVFETNIRVLGGLLGGHVSALALKKSSRGRLMSWYTAQLLTQAEDIGRRLLPAFNTSTGIPYPRVNLRWGLSSGVAGKGPQRNEVDTCTACAGSMILEFAALSRFTGNPVYEEKAARAMNYLWEQRNRHSDLMGTVINIHNGNWVRREAGVGAGIDSYYEYLFKAYVLLGDESYLHRFNTHYDAIQRYVSTLGPSPIPLLLDVHMHQPQQRVKNFMDSLLAFWPGLQVMTGDIKSAIGLHEVLYQVMQQHSFLPEAFTADFHVHWGQHPLRPEFVESTYFLHKATNDSYYLHAGVKVMNNLDAHARVPCGFAAISDVRTMAHEDQLDSFVLAETFKYLYLLFSEGGDLPINLDDYIFTTEAHLLPLSLSQLSKKPSSAGNRRRGTDRHCINEQHSAKAFWSTARHQQNYAGDIRLPLKNVVSQLHRHQSAARSSVFLAPDEAGSTSDTMILRAADFQPTNLVHRELLRRMGIQAVPTQDGNLQLFHHPHTAESDTFSAQGVRFMADMMKLTQQQTNTVEQRFVTLLSPPYSGKVFLTAGPAQFGIFPAAEELGVVGQLVVGSPEDACTPMNNEDKLSGNIAFIKRGGCMFVDKARNLMQANAVAGIVMDTTEGTSAESHGLFAMSGDGKDDVSIPMVFLFNKESKQLRRSMDAAKDPISVLLSRKKQDQTELLRSLLKARMDKTLQDLVKVVVSDVDSINDEVLHQTPSPPSSPTSPIPLIQQLSYQVELNFIVYHKDSKLGTTMPLLKLAQNPDLDWDWKLTIVPPTQNQKLESEKPDPLTPETARKFALWLWSYILERSNMEKILVRSQFKALLTQFVIGCGVAGPINLPITLDDKNQPILNEVDTVFKKVVSQLESDNYTVTSGNNISQGKKLHVYVLAIKRVGPPPNPEGSESSEDAEEAGPRALAADIFGDSQTSSIPEDVTKEDTNVTQDEHSEL